jgi:hypothetical protein
VILPVQFVEPVMRRRVLQRDHHLPEKVQVPQRVPQVRVLDYSQSHHHRQSHRPHQSRVPVLAPQTSLLHQLELVHQRRMSAAAVVAVAAVRNLHHRQSRYLLPGPVHQSLILQNPKSVPLRLQRGTVPAQVLQRVPLHRAQESQKRALQLELQTNPWKPVPVPQSRPKHRQNHHHQRLVQGLELQTSRLMQEQELQSRLQSQVELAVGLQSLWAQVPGNQTSRLLPVPDYQMQVPCFAVVDRNRHRWNQREYWTDQTFYGIKLWRIMEDTE